MVVEASIHCDDGLVGLMLLPIGAREKVGDIPNVEGYDPSGRLWFYWDAEKLLGKNEEYDFLGIEINDISMLWNEDLAIIDQLELPHVDVPEAGMFNASISDVLRWARKVYPSRYSTASV
jgi:hypothetical protein